MREKVISGGLISILLINVSFATSASLSIYFLLTIVITIVGVMVLSVAVHGIPGKVKLYIMLFVTSGFLTIIQELLFKLDLNEIFTYPKISEQGVITDILIPLMVGTVVVLSPFWILPLVGKWKLTSVFMTLFCVMVICITSFSVLLNGIMTENFTVRNFNMSLKIIGWNSVLIGVLVALYRKVLFLFFPYSLRNQGYFDRI